MQAFEAEDIKSGSMHTDFYKMCELGYNDCIELMEYSYINCKTLLFFSVFSPKYYDINTALPNNYIKVSGAQFKNLSSSALTHIDEVHGHNAVMSIPMDHSHLAMPVLKKAKLMHVCEYLAKDPYLYRIDALSSLFKRQVGFSDHTVGIDWCLSAIKDYGVNVIEKHFHMGDVFKFKGKIFRDTVHSAQPDDFEQIAKALK